MKCRSNSTQWLLLCFFLGIFSARAATSLISLSFDATVTDTQKNIFNQAAAFWNSAITGYTLNNNNGPSLGPTHSLSISVSTPYIDGAYNTLGQAGPNGIRPYTDYPVTKKIYYTSTGEMEFDSADVDRMLQSGTFFGVALHEMGHVLGLGTLWTYNTTNGIGCNLYTNDSGQYIGANALREWNSEFGRSDSYVPVELGGSSGTANGHWNEVDNGAGNTGFVSNLTGLDFRYELMTGWASSQFFVSRATLGALEDLGYTVDYSKAGLVVLPVPEPSGAIMLLFAGVLLSHFRRRRDS